MNCLAGTSNLQQWREEGREEGKGRREKRKCMETHDGPISRPDKILSWLLYVTLSVPAMVLCYWLTLTASTNIRPICHNYVQSFLRNSNLSTCFFFPKYSLMARFLGFFCCLNILQFYLLEDLVVYKHILYPSCKGKFWYLISNLSWILIVPYS